jgi:Leucine Rich repeat
VDASGPRRWRWLPRTLRGLLVVVLTIGCALGFIVNVVRPAHRQRGLVRAIEGHAGAGSVKYDWQSSDAGQRRNSELPEWLANHIGADYFISVKVVDLCGPVSSDLLIRIQALDRLEYLRLTMPGPKPPSLKHLKPLGRLKVLRLEGFPVTDEDMVDIGGLIGLQGLSLNLSGVGDLGLSHLLALTHLRNLSLWETKVTDAGMAHLANLRELRTLDLGKTGVGDAGLTHLSKLPNLEDLNLQYSRVTDAGLLRLARLGSLACVDVRHTAVTDAGVKRFRAARPGVDIRGGSHAPPGVRWKFYDWMMTW